MARRKAQTYGSCLLAETRWRLSARHTRSSSEAVAHRKYASATQPKRMLICGVHTAPGPALVRSATLERVDRSFSLLQAGAPIGPGGSSDAARVLMLRPRVRRRRTSSRLYVRSRETPFKWTRWPQRKCGLGRGDKGFRFSVSCPRKRASSKLRGCNLGIEVVPGLGQRQQRAVVNGFPLSRE
jgi:hypothetical protein